MKRSKWWLVSVACVAVAGCSSSSADTTTSESETAANEDEEEDDEGDATDSASASASASMTGADPTLTTTTNDPSTSGPGDTGEPEDDGMSFVIPPDGGGANECDPKAQDCPDGQKCTAWANDGGTFWNANRCIEVSGNGVGGDPCMVEGSGVSGVDDCDLGFICMNTNEENIGTCIKFCQGDNEDCDMDDVCAIYNDGVLPICLLGCDPLLQNCPEMQSCIDTPNASFICFNDASGEAGAEGDPCPPEHGENSCDPGMWCGAGADGCLAGNCCTPFCEVGVDMCMGANMCTAFFAEGDAPPGLEDVGVCIIPA